MSKKQPTITKAVEAETSKEQPEVPKAEPGTIFEPITEKAQFEGYIPNFYSKPQDSKIRIPGSIIEKSGLTQRSQVMISCDRPGEITIRKLELSLIEEEIYKRMH